MSLFQEDEATTFNVLNLSGLTSKLLEILGNDTIQIPTKLKKTIKNYFFSKTFLNFSFCTHFQNESFFSRSRKIFKQKTFFGHKKNMVF